MTVQLVIPKLRTVNSNNYIVDNREFVHFSKTEEKRMLRDYACLISKTILFTSHCSLKKTVQINRLLRIRTSEKSHSTKNGISVTVDDSTIICLSSAGIKMKVTRPEKYDFT